MYSKIKLDYEEKKKLNNELTLSQYFENEKYLERDWYGEFSVVKKHLKPIMKNLKKDSTILILGAGLSTLPVDIYKMGYKNIVCTDISQSLCEMMKEYSIEVLGENSIQYILQDMRNMESTFAENSFDIVIDKATLDSLYMEEDAESYEEGIVDKGIENVRTVQHQVIRILKPKRKWVVFSQYDYSLEPETEEESKDDLISFDTHNCSKISITHDDEESLFVYVLTK
ncbi:predicted protein [Naegleria gruberi]|uniref:Predicted protein n=1 Tax=Naegleria gruberi TaxID=5762 RepID=D2VE05_NAEGR|nr:uncharacterized protein NAEGRDRAFT_48782 [Naegleria gruberi]EFC44991.1 predicted protein [Naegleria gruberi]|eukprot:XP_002677735.1 predicted protein [Naegleria gruberi strain NEG-M]